MGMCLLPWCSPQLIQRGANRHQTNLRSSTLPDASFKELMLFQNGRSHSTTTSFEKSYGLMSRQILGFFERNWNITLKLSLWRRGLVKFFGCFFGFCFFNLCESKPFEGTKEPWGEIIFLIRWTELSDIVGGMRCHDMSPGYLTSIGHVARSLWNFGCGGGAKPLRHHERCSLHNIYEQVNDYINCT